LQKGVRARQTARRFGGRIKLLLALYRRREIRSNKNSRTEKTGCNEKAVHVIDFREKHFVSVRFGVFAAVSVKNGVFWSVTPCGSCKNRRFGGI
jgi:hypothetical protein